MLCSTEVAAQWHELMTWSIIQKVKGGVYLFTENPSHSYGTSPAIQHHTTNVACHPTEVNAAHLNPNRIGWYLIYLLWGDGRLSWPRQLVTYQNFYLPTGSHPYKYEHAQCRATSLIGLNVLPLCTPRHHHNMAVHSLHQQTTGPSLSGFLTYS